MLQMGGLLALVAILTSTQLLSTVRLVLSACSYAEASPCAGADPYAVADPFPEAGPAAPPGLPGCKPAPDWNSHTCMTWRLTSAHLVAADVGALVHAHMPPQTLLLHQSSQPASQGQASRPTALVASAVAAHKQVDTFNVRLAPEQVWRLQQCKAACQTAEGGDTGGQLGDSNMSPAKRRWQATATGVHLCAGAQHSRYAGVHRPREGFPPVLKLHECTDAPSGPAAWRRCGPQRVAAAAGGL